VGIENSLLERETDSHYNRIIRLKIDESIALESLKIEKNQEI
jgi:hypothetical protein